MRCPAAAPLAVKGPTCLKLQDPSCSVHPRTPRLAAGWPSRALPPASPPCPAGPSCWGPRAALPPPGPWCGPCRSSPGPAPQSGPLCGGKAPSPSMSSGGCGGLQPFLLGQATPPIPGTRPCPEPAWDSRCQDRWAPGTCPHLVLDSQGLFPAHPIPVGQHISTEAHEGIGATRPWALHPQPFPHRAPLLHHVPGALCLAAWWGQSQLCVAATTEAGKQGQGAGHMHQDGSGEQTSPEAAHARLKGNRQRHCRPERVPVCACPRACG